MILSIAARHHSQTDCVIPSTIIFFINHSATSPNPWREICSFIAHFFLQSANFLSNAYRCHGEVCSNLRELVARDLKENIWEWQQTVAWHGVFRQVLPFASIFSTLHSQGALMLYITIMVTFPFSYWILASATFALSFSCLAYHTNIFLVFLSFYTMILVHYHIQSI